MNISGSENGQCESPEVAIIDYETETKQVWMAGCE